MVTLIINGYTVLHALVEEVEARSCILWEPSTGRSSSRVSFARAARLSTLPDLVYITCVDSRHSMEHG